MQRFMGLCAALLLLASCGGDDGGNRENVNPPGAPQLNGKVEETASGLRYVDEHVGDGAQPRAGQQVTVHYTGWLTDGKQFDSSRTSGKPFTFSLGRGQVIKGWDEGVATMRVGGKRRLIIPSDLAYGPQGRSSIPPNAVLVFDVELLSVQ